MEDISADIDRVKAAAGDRQERRSRKALEWAEDNTDKAENWERWGSFAVGEVRPLLARGRWAIVYTSNRDSRLMELSNAAAIAKAMEPHVGSYCEADIQAGEPEPDCVEYRASHWAVGYVDGYAIRVTDREGKFTAAWLEYAECMAALEDYPLLDEEDYSRREWEATLENLEEQVRWASGRSGYERTAKYDAAEIGDIAADVARWFGDNGHDRELEDVDDQGGYPSEAATREALLALGYIQADEDESADGAEG